jgi:hypothetical protein
MRACVCRSSLLVLAVVVALSLAACGGGTSDETATTAAPTAGATSTASVLPTVDELDAMLLTVDDVFAGWKLASPINEADLADSIQVPCDNTAINPTIVERLRAVTGVQFEPVDGSYAHLIEFATAGDPARLAADVDALFGALDSCGPSFTGQGGTGSGTLEELALPAGLGDQSKAYVITGKETPDADSVWYGRTAYVRVGEVLISVGQIEMLPADDLTPVISDEEFVQLVQTAVDKVSAS